ncbi:MAG TPA: NADH-quinone oxidoreductase subunit NuoD, partial [Archaeoglobus profundus]|nr:NADH-quinone oxidoreductase subunit NuoD [Archaeoglobus profundus]
ADDGDSYSRFLVRVYEIRESINIIREAIKNIPNGPIISEYLIGKLKEKEKIKKDIKGYLWRIFGRLSLPAGEYTTLTEAARGTLLYTLISDGKSTVPYRLRIVTPGWAYLRGFMEACKGERLADLQAIYGSFGYFPPEADR